MKYNTQTELIKLTTEYIKHYRLSKLSNLMLFKVLTKKKSFQNQESLHSYQEHLYQEYLGVQMDQELTNALMEQAKQEEKSDSKENTQSLSFFIKSINNINTAQQIIRRLSIMLRQNPKKPLSTLTDLLEQHLLVLSQDNKLFTPMHLQIKQLNDLRKNIKTLDKLYPMVIEQHQLKTKIIDKRRHAIDEIRKEIKNSLANPNPSIALKHVQKLKATLNNLKKDTLRSSLISPEHYLKYKLLTQEEVEKNRMVPTDEHTWLSTSIKQLDDIENELTTPNNQNIQKEANLPSPKTR